MTEINPFKNGEHSPIGTACDTEAVELFLRKYDFRWWIPLLPYLSFPTMFVIVELLESLEPYFVKVGFSAKPIVVAIFYTLIMLLYIGIPLLMLVSGLLTFGFLIHAFAALNEYELSKQQWSRFFTSAAMVSSGIWIPVVAFCVPVFFAKF